MLLLVDHFGVALFDEVFGGLYLLLGYLGDHDLFCLLGHSNTILYSDITSKSYSVEVFMKEGIEESNGVVIFE